MHKINEENNLTVELDVPIILCPNCKQRMAKIRSTNRYGGDLYKCPTCGFDYIYSQYNI